MSMETAQTAPSIRSVRTAPCTCTAHPFMAVAVGAQKIGRSKEYLYAGLRQGHFPGVKFGRNWVLYTDFIEGFLADVVEQGLSVSFEDYAAQWIAQAQVGVAQANEVAA